jgi:hypothetical protein
MAYLQQNQVDQVGQQSSQVLGPNGQPINNNQQQAPAQSSGQSAYIEGSQGNGQSPQPSAPAPKKASSGQFTNLRNYIQANQGAGQKIGQQLTGGMEKNAQQIGSAINQQKQQYQAQIGQQEAQRAQAGQQAQATLQQAQNLADTTQQVKQEDIANFQQLAKGQKTFQDVQDMNLTAQQVQQQELARKAEALKSFEGRAGQLKESFGKQRDYGTGKASLDNLLLQSGGNLNQVLNQAKQTSEGAAGQLKSTEQFGREELARLIGENKQFAQGLQTQAETGQSGVISALDQRKIDLAAQRAAELSGTFNPFLTNEQQELADLEKYYGGEAVRRRLVESGEAFGNPMVDNLRRSMLMNYDRNAPNADYGQYKMNTTDPAFRKQFLEDYIKTGTNTKNLFENQHHWDWRVQDILNNALTGKGSAVDSATLSNLGSSNRDIEQLFNRASGARVNTKELNDLIGKIGSGIQSQRASLPKALSDALQQSTGYGFEDYTKGKDISRESLASDADRARYSALSALAGRQASDLQYGKPSDAKLAKQLTDGQMKEMLAKIASSYGRSGVASVPGGGVAGYSEPKKNF